ncbi:hypothetical protein [Rhizobium laguerreae]|uniref:hypothetical protein n=1 Tax=Rhizobium laguerreae TaxID=1076926 RepID=UPI001C9118C5|nr:hypothetical protein [Rhizobium laguerreae]MBY3483328.1 hypothetical protein [Rhizobium laguerreae]
MARLSGKWTIRAIAKEAGWAQGVEIGGSFGQDGVYEMDVGTEILHVEGEEFTVTPKAFNPATNVWVTSLEQERYQWDDNVGMTLTIFADDNPPLGDEDFNDLVVLCIAEDDELVSPYAGLPRPDLTIPENLVKFR